MTRVICLVIIIVSYAATSFAEQTIRLAISANFINAMEELSNIFVKKYGITIHPIYASTGSLYAMIKNGAPIDLFLAADERRPRFLYEAGLCDRPKVYAMGEVVLWTNQNHLISAHDWKEAITAGGVDKIALPSPESAPYGACAKWALERVGLFKRLNHQLVYAQSVAQAYQFIEIGGADMGFVPLSYIKKVKVRESATSGTSKRRPWLSRPCAGSPPALGQKKPAYLRILSCQKRQISCLPHGIPFGILSI